MMKLGWMWTALVVFSAALSGCGSSGSSVDVGSDCTAADAGVAATDCGSLQCLCPRGDVPGVCSKTCTKQADCASLGDDMSCAKDFCTGTSLCLQGYSGDKLP
jgi:hypothetical protein